MAVPSTPVLTPSGLGDLVASSIRDLGRLRYTMIANNLQKYTAMNSLLQKNRIEFQSGYGIQFDVKVGLSQNAANVGLGASDNVNIAQTLTQGTADWRNSVTSYGIIGQEPAMNREPSRIVNLVQSRRVDALFSLTDLMETNFWGPPVALTDDLTPYGVNTWIVKNATEGFNGTVPSGFTTIGGLNPTTYPNWSNWTFPYTAVSKDDAIRKMRKAIRFTGFMPPVQGIPTFNTGDDYGIYTNNNVIQPLEENLEAQNDNLGNDIAPKDNMATFHRSMVEWVPKLEADTTNPIYGINWGEFKTMILSGWWLKETVVPIYPGQHTMSAQFIDSTYNWVLRDRRRCFVGSNGTTYPS